MKSVWRAAAFILLTLSHPAGAQNLVARGRALAVLGDCEGCHDEGARYAGGQPLVSQFGTIYSSNITPDRQTGIGTWSSDNFYTALHRGRRPDGSLLYPAFPYAYFSHLSRADSDALYAYLRTVNPVRQSPPPNRLSFPFNQRPLLVFWNALFLDTREWHADPHRSAAWNRGNFIVTGPGHCAECHSPKLVLFGDKPGAFLQGEAVNDWFASDLTGTRRSGLGDWSAQEIAQYLKTGASQHATAIGPMQEVVKDSTSLMTDADRAAIATYLKSLPPTVGKEAPAHAQTQMADGEAVFVQHCAVCHTKPGLEDGYPGLAGNTLVQGAAPTSVLRIVLAGSQSITLQHGKVSYSMPAFATLSDEEVAAVATYIRNAWGNRGSAARASEVKAMRTAIARDQ